MIKILFTSGLLLLLALDVTAASYQNLEQVRIQTRNYLESFPELRNHRDTVIKINTIDRHLKLTQCNKLSFELTNGSRLLGKLSVKVICKTPVAWSFYITANISRFDRVYMTNNALSRGHIVTQNDVFQSRKDLSRLPFGYITDAKEVVGKMLKRHVQAGNVLTPSQLSAPMVIRRGDIISLKKQAAGFAVSMKGTAMSDGAIGQRIRVKNNSSKRVIEGTITQSGVVMIEN